MTNIKIKSVSPIDELSYCEESMIVNVPAFNEMTSYILRFADSVAADDFKSCLNGEITEAEFHNRHCRANNPLVSMLANMVPAPRQQAFDFHAVSGAYDALKEQVPPAAPDTVRALKEVLSSVIYLVQEREYDVAADALTVCAL